MALLVDCTNAKYLTWEMLVRMLSAVTVDGCAAMRIVGDLTGDLLAENEDYLMTEDGFTFESEFFANHDAVFNAQLRPDGSYQIRPDLDKKLRP